MRLHLVDFQLSSPVSVISARISTIIHATEDAEKVAQAIRNLSLAETSPGVTMNRAKGHHGNEIVTLVLTIRSVKMARSFLQNTWNRLHPLDRVEVYSSLTSRVDDAGTLFIRIDKQEAVKGKIRLQNTDPVKIEISFRTEPTKRNEFVDNIRRMLEEIQG